MLDIQLSPLKAKLISVQFAAHLALHPSLLWQARKVAKCHPEQTPFGGRSVSPALEILPQSLNFFTLHPLSVLCQLTARLHMVNYCDINSTRNFTLPFNHFNILYITVSTHLKALFCPWIAGFFRLVLQLDHLHRHRRHHLRHRGHLGRDRLGRWLRQRNFGCRCWRLGERTTTGGTMAHICQVLSWQHVNMWKPRKW